MLIRDRGAETPGDMEIKMKNVFDITEYGAVGDGAADCTAAIQRALDDAAAVNGTVIVPPGRFCTGELRMGKHTRLEGGSAWSFRTDGVSTLVLNDPEARFLIDITGAFGCTISGVCLDGRELGRCIHGVYLRWERYNGGDEEDTPTIDDCRIGRFSGDGLHYERVWCFSVRHSMIHGNAGSGLYIDGWDAFIMDNWFTFNKKSGIRGGPITASVTATGNRVEWNGESGIYFHEGDSINITGNFFDRTFGPALRLSGGFFRDCAVTGNVFRRSGCPDGMNFESEYENSHVYLDNVSNVTLTGNTFRWGENDGGGGTKSPDYDIYLANSDASVIQGNVMKEGSLKDSIVYDGRGDIIIKDNIASPAKTDR